MPPAGGPCFADHLVEVGEAGVLKDGSPAERRQPLDGDVQSLRVPVEPKHPEPGVGGEQGGGVPPGPDGRVEDDAWWDRGEEFHHLGGHDRLVYRIPVHPQPPDGRGAVREFPLATDGEEGGGGVFHRAGRGAAHVPGAMPSFLVCVASSVSLLSSLSQSSSSSRNHCSDGCTRSSQTAGFHNSIRSIAPITSTSVSNRANSRNRAMIAMRPCRSTSTSWAFDAQNRARLRSSRPAAASSCIPAI